MLLFLPFLLVASAMVAHQSVRALKSYVPVLAMPDQQIAPLRPRVEGTVPLAAMPQPTAGRMQPTGTALPAVAAAPSIRSAPRPDLTLDASPVEAAARPVTAADHALSPETGLADLKPLPPPADGKTGPAAKIALLAPAESPLRSTRPVSPDPIASFEADASGRPIRSGICAIDEKPDPASAPRLATVANPSTLDSETFGLHLAKAAESQASELVIYNDAYRSLSYPMGDVHALYGVCTDVVVRAYRAVGLDLQALVHRARSGSGDTSIDQRRTEVLRRFFATHGESLPVTTFPEDYRPGDIVTYYRPQNRRTRAHIAIVSARIAPSGRPMIVHNRGWGPQLEDALFVDEITGHYRYRGPAPMESAAAAGGPLAPATVDAPVLPASFGALPLPAATRRY